MFSFMISMASAVLAMGLGILRHGVEGNFNQEFSFFKWGVVPMALCLTLYLPLLLAWSFVVGPVLWVLWWTIWKVSSGR